MAPILLKQMVYLYSGYNSVTWWRHQWMNKYGRSPLVVVIKHNTAQTWLAAMAGLRASNGKSHGGIIGCNREWRTDNPTDYFTYGTWVNTLVVENDDKSLIFF